MSELTFSCQITWLYTHDLARSHDFYSGVLGLEIQRDEGQAKIYRTADGAALGVCEVFDDRVVEPAGSMISLVTNSVDSWYSKLESAGVKAQGPPHHIERFGIYTFFVKDPDGYILEFQQFV